MSGQVSQLERRRIEAGVLAAVYETLAARRGPEEALAVVTETTQQAARQAGQAFAATAPQGPGLRHFATVLDIWRGGRTPEASGDVAIDAVDERLDTDAWSFRVRRCGYSHMYLREMGLSPDLAHALSCARDAAFAQGYSPRLRMERSATIAQGAPECLFRFVWDPA